MLTRKIIGQKENVTCMTLYKALFKVRCLENKYTAFGRCRLEKIQAKLLHHQLIKVPLFTRSMYPTCEFIFLHYIASLPSLSCQKCGFHAVKQTLERNC